jgi:hypothetical protein
LNFPGFRKSSVFRGRHSVRLLTALIAVLVQLHIFLVLELHQHVLGSRFLREVAATSASITGHHPAPAGRPLCPACQVARQGAVQPAVERLALVPLKAIAAALPTSPSFTPTIFFLHPSGRDPPRG